MNYKNYPDSGLDAIWFSIEDIVFGKRTPTRGDLGALRIYLKSLLTMPNPPQDVVDKITQIIKSFERA